MSTTHVVVRGECIESIAARYGFFAEGLWEHAGNEALRKLRRNPHVLEVGDEVFIPASASSRFRAATGSRSRTAPTT